MYSTDELIQSLNSDLSTLKTNVAAKGVVVTEQDNFTTLSTKVASIPSGGGFEMITGADFYDYDGTLLQHYTKEQIAEMSEITLVPPEHNYLVFQRWNWTLEQIKSEASNQRVIVGPEYDTIDHGVRIIIKLDEPVLSPKIKLGFRRDSTGATLAVDWGDGTVDNYDYETQSYSYFVSEHTYSQGGIYEVKLLPSRAEVAYIASPSNYSNFTGIFYDEWEAAEGNSKNNLYYQTALVEYNSGSYFNNVRNSLARSSCPGFKVSLSSSTTSLEINAFDYCGAEFISLPSSFSATTTASFQGCPSLKTVSVPYSFGQVNTTYTSGININSCPQFEYFTCVPGICNIHLGYTTSPGTFARSKMKYLYLPNLNRQWSNSTIIPWNIISADPRWVQTCLDNYVQNPGTPKVLGGAFTFMRGLTSVTIPSKITQIIYTFMGCYDLTSVTFSNGLIKIADQAFSNCYNLGNVQLPSTLTEMSSSCFSNTAITSITVPKSVYRVNGCFTSCTELVEATFEKGSILNNNTGSLFLDCPKLERVVFDKSVSGFIVSTSCFANCISLRYVKFPNNIASFGNNAMAGCTDVTCDLKSVLSVPTIQSTNVFSVGRVDSFKFLIPSCLFSSWTTATNWTTLYTSYPNSFISIPMLNVTYTTPSSDVTLTVTDSEDNVISAYGDAGTYSARYVLEPGTYTVTAEATGYVSHDYTVTITNADVALSIELESE